MKFEYIILLVIAFNVVTAFLQKRAKAEKAKRLAEAAAAKSLDPSPRAPKTARIEIIRKNPEPEWDPEEDEDGEHAHTGNWHVEEEGEEHLDRRSQPIVRPEPERIANTGTKAKEKVATLGKGLLEQLAKELGLRLPEKEAQPEAPESGPSRTISIPQPMPVHFDLENTHVMTATTAASPPPTARSAAENPIPFGLDARKMREAVALREILDKPVSLRAGRFK